MATKTFPNKMTRYLDTRKAGGITIQGIELDTDEDGFVEAPGGFVKEMIPHGFYPEGSPEYNEWVKAHPIAQKTGKK